MAPTATFDSPSRLVSARVGLQARLSLFFDGSGLPDFLSPSSGLTRVAARCGARRMLSLAQGVRGANMHRCFCLIKCLHATTLPFLIGGSGLGRRAVGPRETGREKRGSQSKSIEARLSCASSPPTDFPSHTFDPVSF
ncbi:hypothetical protein GOBAR_AA12007 [Gossypium barbadense]|uniref:Uncharacterized protein n=1 Tax=Gossypium barbadense TaxID=3634 RepID=A0A2P5XZ86_GOSBA|nr:hypothetical protein GOBAR_AA12007 [Gossypium barbadense]